jgi:hypothetical protein
MRWSRFRYDRRHSQRKQRRRPDETSRSLSLGLHYNNIRPEDV